MEIYNFDIDGLEIGVTAEKENEYHVSIDGKYIGIMYTSFLNDPPFIQWYTGDLICDDLVYRIGEEIMYCDR
ncbi:hypothetical protein [Pedobacter sp. BMA]|uniref:hypothetical protein n=1 Tax=Pedobacter sp. BMA TaxID=1663685 RepID=UPI00064B1C77|nr:hypothetical protein [Pedobacter sp. BMA]KLT63903.1 hypothetical protein AB669_19425 [Pedobacter sp. BMA]